MKFSLTEKGWCFAVMLLRSEVMLRIVMLPFGQLWYHFVMIEIQNGTAV